MSIFVWLYSVGANRSVVLNVNRDTGNVKAVELPSATLEGITAHARLVFRDYMDSTVYIVQDDLSVRSIDLKSDIFQLIEADGSKIIAVNYQLFDQNGMSFIETFVIDVSSGEFSRELVRSPAFADPLNIPDLRSDDNTFAGWLITISANLEYVYLFYNHKSGDENYKQAIGMFDAKSLAEVNSVKDPSCITLINQSKFSSLQYRNISYPRTAFTNPEGLSQGLNAPIDLSTLKPLVDTEEIIKAEHINTLRFVPFGDYFAIGTNSRVILISLNGENVVEYPLPWERLTIVDGTWEYRIMEYNNATSAP